MNLSERYSKKIEGKVEEIKVKKSGVLLQLEVTNTCNHRCIFCPNIDSKRKKKMMDFDLAKRVMKESAEFWKTIRRFVFI